MKKLSVFLTILVFLFLIISCETDNLPTNAEKSSSIEQFDNDVEKIEISEIDLALLNNYTLEKSSDNEQLDAVIDEVLLKYFAMAMAKSLKHPDICKILKNKIGDKFDGDFDVLWEQIKNSQIAGQKMRELVNSRFSERTRQVLTLEKIEAVPLLQISLPVNFDDWDGESTILVAYTPLTIDDMDWKEIYAYDADMKECKLDAKTEPDFPVMVVGINERVEYLQSAETQFNRSLGKTSAGGRLSEEYLYRIKIFEDGEGWLSGDPEIYIVSAGTNNTYNRKERANLPSVNEIDHWYYPNIVLFNWETEIWGPYTGYGVFEYDPDIYNYSVTILTPNVEVKVKNKDNDDFIGNIYSIPYSHTTLADYAFDDVQMRLFYYEE